MNQAHDSAEERQPSSYDLLCQVVEPQQARHVTRILTELCHCDENSYPFLQGILNVTQLRLGLTLPEAVAKRIDGPLEEFHRKSQLLLEALDYHQITSKKRVEQSVAASGWPFTRAYKGKIAHRLQSIIRRCEEKVAYRARWLALIWFSITTVCFIGLYQHYCSNIARNKQQDLDQYLTLQNASAEQSAEQEKRHAASIEQRSTEIAHQKLQNLEPRSYHLAQLIENSASRVRFANGIIAWQVVIRDLPEWPRPRYDYDTKSGCTVTYYFPDTNGEVSLSGTSPSASPKAKAKSQ